MLEFRFVGVEDHDLEGADLVAYLENRLRQFVTDARKLLADGWWMRPSVLGVGFGLPQDRLSPEENEDYHLQLGAEWRRLRELDIGDYFLAGPSPPQAWLEEELDFCMDNLDLWKAER